MLTGHGAAIDTTTAAGKLVFGIFAALSEFEREMIKERTLAGMASLGQRETKIGPLCKELGITKQTLYRHVSPSGELREDGKELIGAL